MFKLNEKKKSEDKLFRKETNRSTGLRASAMCCVVSVFIIAAAPPPVSGTHIVAADHVLASKAGAKTFARGGNSVDAAVAAALAAGVVQPAGSGLGGGGFAVFVRASGADGHEKGVLDFREVAPTQATETMFQDERGHVIAGRSRIGGHAVAVPAEGVGLAHLVNVYGQLSLKDVAAPAIELAERGFIVGAQLATALEKTTHTQVLGFFNKDGTPIVRYQRFSNKPLARTLRRWARSNGTSLQSGADAHHIVDAVRSQGGVLTVEDLGTYVPKEREPIVSEYKGYTLVTMPPPSSGGIVLSQVLQVLEATDVSSLSHNSSEYVHRLTEAMKHAYADRAHHLGDPDFVTVPTDRLLSEERIHEIRGKFNQSQTYETDFYGKKIAPPQDAGTQHISAQDASGGVALTTTINTSFGSGVVVPELGLILNNQMDDFSAAPGVQNAYGLIGSEANAIMPGKKPLSSMTPTVVLDDGGDVFMVIGASGGSTIISSTIQVFLNIVEFGMNPQEAVAAPRMHHQWIPASLILEPEFPVDVTQGLEDKGHAIKRMRAYSSVQVTVKTRNGFVAGSDPRKGGVPASVQSLGRRP